MRLNNRTLEKLRQLINEETEYRTGSKLVEFFNNFGFNDTYTQGFPSRRLFTDEKLKIINGTSDIDKCIKNVFAPENFIERFKELDKLIEDFNQYFAFDNWQVIRSNIEIIFRKYKELDIDKEIIKETGETEQDFLQKKFELDIGKLPIDSNLLPIINSRIEEIKRCMQAKAPLASIFLAGSTLEGILLNIAIQKPEDFNTANASPKDKNGKAKLFKEWGLNNFIDVSCEIGLLNEDVKKFSHGLKDFRNYIHPYAQMQSKFEPDIKTAEICCKVLEAAIFQLCKNINSGISKKL